MFNTREKFLIKIIIQKKTLKRTRLNNKNNFTQLKFFKNTFNKLKKNLINLIINLIFNFLINTKLTLIINAKYAIILKENENKIKRLDSKILFVTIITKKIIKNSIVFINKKNN